MASQDPRNLSRRSLSRRLHAFLESRSRAAIVATGLALACVVGAADYFTGFYLSFGLFYVAPVSLLAWYGSRRAGLLSSVLCALTWHAVNAASAPSSIPAAILAWNSAVRFGFFVIIASLLASQREAYEGQRALAETDSLTGLLNARAFKEAGRQEMTRSRLSGQGVAALYIDLDGFKALNDTKGHAAGDALLAAVAGAIRGSIRARDVASRVGGDEFAVLLSCLTPAQAEATASRLQKAIHRLTADAQPSVTASMGVAPSDGSDELDELLRRADAAMYRGKVSGKATVTIDASR